MKICLCGSTKYMDQFHEANASLTLSGHIVYSVATSVKGDFQPTADEKLVLDMVHLCKIQESDLIIIVGKQPDGSTYIGESTRREIMYAAVLGKQVILYSKEIFLPIDEFSFLLKTATETDVFRAEKEAQSLADREEFRRTFSRD